METRPDLPATLPRQRLQFTYDHAGRRVRKEVLDWDGTEFTSTTDTWFLWHGWQMIAEGSLHPSSFNLHTSYTWGHDLTGTFEGAGTIGGLLAVTSHLPPVTSHYPVYDGNGNLVAAIDATTGEPAARFTYTPFGETLTASGPAADQINFRFSTKYTDPETGLLYYGLRFYNPETGRWINRDPIGEDGGYNLYGFAGNDLVGAIDFLGLFVLYVHREGWGHVGIITDEGTTYDYGRYHGTYRRRPFSVKGPNILRRSFDTPSNTQNRTHTFYNFDVCPNLDRRIRKILENKFDGGQSAWPEEAKKRFRLPPDDLGVNERYMGTDWSANRNNCITFTFRVLVKAATKVRDDRNATERERREATRLVELAMSVVWSTTMGSVQHRLDLASSGVDWISSEQNLQNKNNESNNENGACCRPGD